MKNIKIVVVGTFNPHKPDYHPTVEEDDYYLASWGGLWAKRLKKRYPDVDIEVWGPDPEFKDSTEREAYNVPCMKFPFRAPIVSKTITYQMLKRLLKYQLEYDLIIHRNTIFDWKFNLLMPILLPKARVILSHHGGVMPYGLSIKSIIRKTLLMFSLKKIDTLTYLRRELKEQVSLCSKAKLIFLPVGADFELFRPLDKEESRKKLGLPLNKLIAVYVGAFYRLKGVDHILRVNNHFKEKNFEVILAGGSKSDELYEEVVLSGCRYWGHVNQEKLREIFSAADFYIHPAFNEEFGGIDVVSMETLACNRPVLSPMFRELDFDYKELGILVENENELLDKTQEMIDSYDRFTKCREYAKKELDGNTAIIDKLYKIYNEF